MWLVLLDSVARYAQISKQSVHDAVGVPQRVLGVHPTASKTWTLALHALGETFWIIGAYTDPGGLTVPTRALSSDSKSHGLHCPVEPWYLGWTDTVHLPLTIPLSVSRQVTRMSLLNFSFPKKMFCGSPTISSPKEWFLENHPCSQRANQGQSHLWQPVTRAGGSAWRCPKKVQGSFFALIVA